MKAKDESSRDRSSPDAEAPSLSCILLPVPNIFTLLKRNDLHRSFRSSFYAVNVSLDTPNKYIYVRPVSRFNWPKLLHVSLLRDRTLELSSLKSLANVLNGPHFHCSHSLDLISPLYST